MFVAHSSISASTDTHADLRPIHNAARVLTELKWQFAVLRGPYRRLDHVLYQNNSQTEQ